MTISLRIPLSARDRERTIARFVNISVDFDTHEKMVKGLNRYKAATVHGSMHLIPFSTSSLGMLAYTCCLSWVMTVSRYPMYVSTVAYAMGIASGDSDVSAEKRTSRNGA
jgi:hypothetical protein